MLKNTALTVQSRLLRSSTLAGVFMLSGLVGCGNDFVDATPAVSQVGKGLTLFDDIDVLALKGTYHGCTTYADSVVWSMATGAGTPDADQVKVVKGNTACRLMLSSIDVNVGPTPTLTNFTAAVGFDMVAAYQSQAVLFTNGANNFYANAKLADLLYAGNFGVSMLYAEDPSSFTDGAVASFALISSNSVTATGVPTPDYTSSSTVAIVVQQNYSLDVDATGVVLLTHQTVGGDKYILSQTNPGTMLSDMDSFWTTNMGSAVAITGTSAISLDAVTAFNLVATTSLSSPIVWYVLVANWDAANTGTRSYEKFTITFTKP